MTNPHPLHHYTVQIHRGRPVLCENEAPRPLVMYSPGSAFGNTAREDVDRFLAAGVTDFYLWVGRDEGEKEIFTTPWWRNVNELGEPAYVAPERFWSLPERVDYILARCPAARFLVRWYAHPPKSWKAAHPEELAVDEHGTIVDEVSLASQRFDTDYRRALAHTLRWIERQPWAWRVLGYVTLHDYEGTTLNSLMGMVFDYSAPMQRAFREFAPQAGGVPVNRFPDEHERGGYAHWPEPATTVAERAYLELVRSLFLGRCRLFVETVQQVVAPRRVLIGMDALKQGMQGWICNPFFEGKAPRSHQAHTLAASGSTGADEFFRIDGFNILNTPYDYIYRHMGAAYEPEGIVDSWVLRGKLFLGENDYRTYACAENGSFGYARNPVEATAGLWRTAAETIARGSHAYWMDVTSFPTPKGGYFRDPAIMDTIREIAPVLRRSLDWDHADVPGIALIVDDKSAFHEDLSSTYQNLAVMWQRLTGLAHTGVPYRVYLWEDLLADNLPDHRLFIFPNLFLMNPERLDILRRRVCRAGRVVLWGPGTAITDGTTLGADWTSQVTGLPMTFLNESFARRVVLTRFDHPITARLHGAISYGDSEPYGPMVLPQFAPDVSDQGIVLTARGVQHPGLAIKQIGQDAERWTSVFTAAVPVPADLLREMARHGGAHVYSEDNDVIMASHNFLGVHSVRRGRRTIKLPTRTSVWDVIADKPVSDATDHLDLDVTGPQTRLYRLNL